MQFKTQDDNNTTENVYGFDPQSSFDPRSMLEGSAQPDFLQTNMAGSNFSGLHFERADFRHSYLNGSDFSGAVLQLADFSHANLEGTDFRSADLANATFKNTKCLGAIFDSRTVLPFDRSMAKSLGMIEG